MNESDTAGAKRKQITVGLPDDRYAELFAVAAITGIAAASIVRSAIFEKLDQMKAAREAAKKAA